VAGNSGCFEFETLFFSIQSKFWNSREDEKKGGVTPDPDKNKSGNKDAMGGSPPKKKGDKKKISGWYMKRKLILLPHSSMCGEGRGGRSSEVKGSLLWRRQGRFRTIANCEGQKYTMGRYRSWKDQVTLVRGKKEKF